MKTSIIISAYWLLGILFAAWIYVQHDNTSTDAAIAMICLWAAVFMIAGAIYIIRKKRGSQ